ncbi:MULTISPECIES: MarR family winged helix-turn-helix transcriptional regulator [unclassified Microbacterium]|uniref:MarR family winged helix-turn-helix transcriptional regulator n=1 Tax=unclassified Microbacterium TaxID=2609290 RepID=UPI00214B4A27|nr:MULTISPECIES: MarR family winged helix-turn-helix transcriptional regulator [unclassified Microbacterium]MCR2784620.1 MarR family winged helix-turn-helix transcriptional regulator [Microbacterium sp. zg.B96]WIM16163.1 MarR family winged helix-turn-helix transcriptional regulator [Microbacterium sp. zg-B96]
MPDDVVPDDRTFTQLAELVIDIAREVQLRTAQSTPVVPLTPTQGQVMRFVHRHPGCSASDVADGSGLQRANASTALRELRERGYITSQRDADDGRAIRIHATELSDATIATLQGTWAALLERAWRTGGPSDAEGVPADVTAALTRIHDGLGADRATKAFAPATPAPGARGADSTHPDR